MKKIQFLMATALGAGMVTPAIAQADGDTPVDTLSSGNAPIIVTAQRQAQSLQDVPIAVSAFDAEALESQQIENASDLQLTLPNVSFTKSNFTASSFTIRGIGDLCVGNSCDSATAIHLNGAPVIGTRLFEAEYFDLDRIEVLRGPQGTLFGRNATSGVVNVITARPNLSEFQASGQVEYGNYDSFEVQGMVNVPLADWAGVRLAGIYVNRDGYTRNLFDNSRIDGRELYGLRGSIRLEPTPDTVIDLVGYYFREDDDRLRIQKQACQRDPTGVLGCLNARREFGQVNSNSNFTGVLTSQEFLALNGIPTAFALGSLYGPDGYSNFQEPQDPRVVNTAFTPEYVTDELQLQLHVEHDFGDVNVAFTGAYSEGAIDSRQDYNLGIQDRTLFAPALTALAGAAAGGIPGLPAAYFAPIANALIPGGPGGQICTSDTVENGLGAYNGQSICANVPLQFDRSNGESHGWSFETIVTSDFDGPVNFLLGATYVERDVSNGDYYVNAFAIDYLSGILGAFNTFPANLPPSFLGSPYFRSNTTDFRLESYGLFGEVYWDITDDLTFTGGLRYNIDEKENTARTTLASFLVPFGTTTDIFDSPFVATYDADPGRPGNQLIQNRTANFAEVTGRAVLDWQYTPDNSVYVSYSRGYKSGGINPPLSPLFSVPETFAPESIDAFEIGSRNVLFDGSLTLNATAFYYKYSGLQLSRIVARTSVNDNVDANIWGLELEAVWNPIDSILINFGASYLNTEVSGDRFFTNQRDPSGGDPNSVIVKDIAEAFNCAVTSGSLANTAGFVGAVNGGLGLQAPAAFPADSGLGTTLGAFSLCNVLAAQAGNPALQALFPGIQVFAGQAPGITAGIPVNISGNELPQAPDYKLSIGAQYTAEFDNGMSIVPRVDAAYTGESFGNIFNGDINRLPGYWQVNAQLQFNGADDRWFVRAFVQNLFNDDPVTGLYLTDQSSGLFTNIFTLEPRRYGIAAGFNF